MIKILDKDGKELLALEVDSLRRANLRGSYLRYADLSYADLSYADLSGADLRYADLRHANLHGANLHGANLRGANLSGSYLRGANLRGANLNGSDLIIITWSHWETYITPGHIRIGCQSHGLESWKNFNDEQISEMDSKAIDFWKQNKELIIGLCERFEVKNTGDENE